MISQDSFDIFNTQRLKRPSSPATAIVLVAFGTTRPPALKLYASIGKLYRSHFPRHEIRWAFTSMMVRQKLKRECICVDSPVDAARKLKREGYNRAVFQSLHVVPGQEFEKLHSVKVSGLHITAGRPLLDASRDIQQVSEMLLRDVAKDEVTVFVTHGNEKFPRFNSRLIQLQHLLQQQKQNGFLCSVEGEPPGTSGLDDAKRLSQSSGSVTFVPLMLVDGIHIADDVMGKSIDSWSRRVAARQTVLRPPLGARTEICELFVRHTRDALKRVANQRRKRLS
jgi:sirohydrochlorin cobaltochelatase